MVQLGSDRSTLGPMVEAILKERGRTLGRRHRIRSAATSSARIISRSRRRGVPALSLSEPKQFTGPNAAELKKKQEEYNGKDYHQPSDQFDPSWDFSGGVNDMRVLAQLGWRIAQPGGTAEVQRRRSVRPSQEEITGESIARTALARNSRRCDSLEPFVTLDEIRAARERIKTRRASRR